MTKNELGQHYFKQGYNCAQAVVLSFVEELQIDKQTALSMIAGFGAGMGRLRDVCGAVSGMIAVLGAKFGSFDPCDSGAKAKLYQQVQLAVQKFRQINGSSVCRELLSLKEQISSPTPEERTQDYYKKRPCAQLVGCACEIVEEILKQD